MKKYQPNASTQTRTIYGHELLAGLLGFPQTRALADTLRPVNERLQAAGADRVARYVAVVQGRAGARIAELNTECEIRTFASALEAAEGGRRGPAFRGIFVDGLTAAISPRRHDQARDLRKLVGRVQGSTVPAAVDLGAEWIPRLTTAADQLEAALGTLDAALAAHDEAFRDELNCRAEHSRVVDDLMGRVRSAFPEDRARQDAVFPQVTPPATRKPAPATNGSSTTAPASSPNAPVS